MLPSHSITDTHAAKQRIISEKSSEKCMIFRAFSYSKNKKARLFNALPPSKERTGMRLITARNKEHIPQNRIIGCLKNRNTAEHMEKVRRLRAGPASDIKKSWIYPVLPLVFISIPKGRKQTSVIFAPEICIAIICPNSCRTAHSITMKEYTPESARKRATTEIKEKRCIRIRILCIKKLFSTVIFICYYAENIFGKI